MLFNSSQFLLFFSIVTDLFFLVPHKFNWSLLHIASCYFYKLFKLFYILILFFRRKKTPFVYTPNAEKENRFINLMSINIKRKIFVVITPYHSSYIRTLKGRNSANRFLEEIKKLSNVAVLDYSDAAYPDSMFINTTHLNYIGANRFSRQLKTEFNKYTPEYFK